jgi:hypothetical protein
MRITLCDTILKGDIPMFDCTDSEKGLKIVTEWLETKNFKTSVFVCFSNNPYLPDSRLSEEQTSFFVSNDWVEVTDFVADFFSCESFVSLDFCVFEFSTYEDAFGYCKDLKEGF